MSYQSQLTEYKVYINDLVSKCEDKVVLKNVEELLKRSIIGYEKYGTTLEQNEDVRAKRLQHAKEEALDLANYLEWEIQKSIV